MVSTLVLWFLIDVHGQVDIDRFIILYSQSDIHRDAVNRGAGRRVGVQSGRGWGPGRSPSSAGSTLARRTVRRGPLLAPGESRAEGLGLR